MVLIIRELQLDDYHKEYLNLINVFTRKPEPITFNQFSEIFNKINYKIFVIELNNQIVASVSLSMDHHFHNNLSKIGEIGDLVVCSDFQKQGIGKLMVDFCIDLCKKDCYKIVLNCNESNIPFYKKCGFIEKGFEMTLYINPE